MMSWLILSVNLIALLATLLGEPAPRGIGPVEALLAASCGVAAILAVRRPIATRVRADPSARLASIVVVLLVTPVALSLGVSAVRGAEWVPAVRSVAPYLACLGFAVAGAPEAGLLHVRRVTYVIVAVGLLHSAYLLALYAGVRGLSGTAETIRLARITLLDPRTTMPLALAAAVAPWATIPGLRRFRARLGLTLLAAVATLAVVATQTRSMIMAASLGAGVALFGATALHQARRAGSTVAGLRRGVAALAIAGVLALVVIAALPPLRSLAGAVILRATQEGDTGRVENEWAPVLASLGDEGLEGALWGVGAGGSFVTAAGQDRTYIHNLILYGLYYSGLPGGGMWVLAYVLLIAGLLKRGWREREPSLFALGGVVLALCVYGQFFAVHKLFSYNLLLMLAIQCLAAGPRRVAE